MRLLIASVTVTGPTFSEAWSGDPHRSVSWPFVPGVARPTCPLEEPPVSDSPLTRRAVLKLFGVSGLVVVSGCRRSDTSARDRAATSGVPAAPTPSGSKVESVAARVADAERDLLTAYDAAIGAHPELAPKLSPLRAEHAAHLVGVTPSASTATPTPSPSATPNVTAGSATAAPAQPPASQQSAAAGVLAGLAALERGAAAARLADLGATSGSLARLIASIGGCEAAHAALLESPLESS